MEHNSEAHKVKTFTEESTQTPCPAIPQSLNQRDVFHLLRMVMSELTELAATVTNNKQECLDFLQNALQQCDFCEMFQDQFHDENEKTAAQADACVDTWYYILNWFAKHGINLSRIFDLVHEANMNKRDPMSKKFLRRQPDGKILKPHNWTPPDITKEIIHQKKNGAWN